MADLADLDEVLADYGVDAGEPERRRTRAGTLLAAGLDGPGLRLLADHAAKAARGDLQRCGALLAYRLAEEPRWRALLADLRRAGPVVAAAAEPQPEPYFGAGQWRREHGADEAERDWTARRAYCRVVSDRADRRAVAADLGVSLEDLEQLVERGRVLQRPAADPRPLPAPEPRRRLESIPRPAPRTKGRRGDGLTGTDALLPALRATAPQLAEQVRRDGCLDMLAVLTDPVRAAAYATLTADAAIVQSGDGWPVVPHRLVTRAEERQKLVAERRAAEQRELLRPRLSDWSDGRATPA